MSGRKERERKEKRERGRGRGRKERERRRRRMRHRLVLCLFRLRACFFNMIHVTHQERRTKKKRGQSLCNLTCPLPATLYLDIVIQWLLSACRRLWL